MADNFLSEKKESLEQVNQFLSELYQEFKDVEPKGKFYKGTSKEIGLLKSFFEIHDQKVRYIKEFVVKWESGELSKLKEFSIEKKVLEFNKKLKPIIKKLVKIDKKNELILGFILTHRQISIKTIKKKEVIEKLELYYKKIEENLNFLYTNLHHQSQYLNRFKEDFGGKFVEDIKDHGAFYMMLSTEINTDQQLKQLLGHIIEMMDYEYKTEEEEKFKISHLQFYEEILDPSSSSFYDYYNMYSVIFPKSEQDSKALISEYTRLRAQMKHITINHSRTYLLVVKQAEKVIGGISLEFMPIDFEITKNVLKQKNALSALLFKNKYIKKIYEVPAGTRAGFGICWYIVTNPDYKINAIKIYNKATSILINEAKVRGYISKGVIGEVESPEFMLKIDPELIKESLEISIDPNKRLRLFSIWGNYTFDFRYIVPAVEGYEAYDYLKLRCKIYDPVWGKKKKVPIHEFIPLLYSFMKNGWGIEKPENNKEFLEMVESIKDEKYVKLKKIDDYIDKSIIKRYIEELVAEGKIDEKKAKTI